MDKYQLCSCCHELVCLKSMWKEYTWMGRTEVYGKMLKDCFNLSWTQRDETKDLICEVCITLLRNAVQFKQKVLQCQSSLQLRFEDGISTLKEELQIDLEGNEDDNISLDTEIAIMKLESMGECKNEADNVFNDEDTNSSDVPLIQEKKTELNYGAIRSPPKRKPLKRKITDSRTNNLRKSTRMSQEEVDKNAYIKPRQNVALILEHSTILPFKSRAGYFNCFYCNKQFAGFDELKTHVSELHDNITFKCIIKSIYRPRDRIRADVSDINCRICKKKIDNLDFLIQHLTDDHNVKFNFDSDSIKPANCILPYDLSEGKYRCYQCKEEFYFFKTLSNHMNEHSTDHVCDVCGRCFLLADRLRAHSQTHTAKSIVKCDLCGKICGSKMLLKSHIRYKHQKLGFKCSICDEAFNTSQKRVKHLEEVHNRAQMNLNCKICSRKFESTKNLYCHMRSDHMNIKREPKFGCSVCDMMFTTNNGLSNHMVVHSGEKKYECEICHKKYGRRKTLMEHLRIHKNDRRFACGACSQAFVQKCSLKNHIRVHHGDMDYDKLIVDKKLDVK